MELLEKVQPHATGLPIPQSKRPLEYARKYRQPTENWPHPNPAALEPAARIPLMTMRDEEQQQQQVLSTMINSRVLSQLRFTLGYSLNYESPPVRESTLRSQPSLISIYSSGRKVV